MKTKNTALFITICAAALLVLTLSCNKDKEDDEDLPNTQNIPHI